MADSPRNEKTAAKPAQRRNILLAAGAALGAAMAAFMVFSQDREFAVDLMRALFGLAGGATAGGQ
ncbi:hypothetical protein [Methylocystis heyeri]|uniref:Uncharacterized protein n=1 Tax=Methylocystis heyeri TaxID=391905 RepID=A0A6B8KAM7_9HYPH|nr:hypothetical protein [Methylocystis heyeri]QGM45374.1 hypothetical protein H2LOC_006495 [Methylocystis heyeri]